MRLIETVGLCRFPRIRIEQRYFEGEISFMMNGEGYEEYLEEYSDYDQDDDSDKHRSKSRDRSRKRERKHHHKRRRHRRRSRSRSRSRSHERATGRVHINPNFTNLGPTASSLLETNNILEAEVIRLRNELSCTNIRIRALENELSNNAVVRANLEQELSVSRVNCQKFKQTATKNSQSVTSLRNDVNTMRKEKERAQELLKQTEMQLSANSEQMSFLTNRNDVLRRKCEELVEKNRVCREERDEAVQLVASMRRELDNIQSAAEMRALESKRVEGDLNILREKERTWKIEKLELERKLVAKDTLIGSEKRRMEEQRKRDKAQLMELEKKLKCEQPGWESQLGVEAVFRTIEAIKNEFIGQLQQLNDRVVPLKEKSCEMAAYQLASTRPPRILSAPPLSDVNISQSRLKCSVDDQDSQTVSTSSPTTEEVPSYTEQELLGGDDDAGSFEDIHHDLISIDEEAILNN